MAKRLHKTASSLLISISIIALLFIFKAYPLIFKSIFLTSLFIYPIMWLNAKRVCIYTKNALDLKTSLEGTALSTIASLVTPFRTSEFMRPVYYCAQKKISFEEGTAAVLTERCYDMIVLFFFVPLMTTFTPSSAFLSSHFKTSHLIYPWLGLMLILVFFLSTPTWVKTIVNRIPFHRMKTMLFHIYQNFRSMVIQNLNLLQIGLTILVWTASWFSYWIFLYTTDGPHITLSETLFIFMAGTIGLSVTITPGGLGTFEALMTYVLSLFGFSPSMALASAFGLRMMNLIPAFVIVIHLFLKKTFQTLSDS